MERPIGYVRQSFFYGRHFLNDADLNAQALSWVTHKANRRIHRTTGEAPDTRFLRGELATLQPLARTAYRGVVAVQEPACATTPAPLPQVEHRPLSVYGRLAGGYR
ncbi:hypothetical protein [Cupriavidus pauculus]|uniref:hypothetical protein n=1 Tax=uncultured Aquabacterium sp. TaxID=158753 RepID=UPI0025CEABA6|nr:hypothetical protein [uncultured Aquabacterium sp.]